MTLNFLKWKIEITKIVSSDDTIKPGLVAIEQVLPAGVLRDKILQLAKNSIDQHLCQNFEYGSAESINNIFELATGKSIGGGSSTNIMYWFLINRPDFRILAEAESLQEGDIVISPTDQNDVIMGAVGIYTDQGVIANNPLNGLLHYVSKDEWRNKYKFTRFFRLK